MNSLVCVDASVIIRYNRPRAYDAAYLALAELRGCEFWTTDERLYNAVSHDLTWVKWVGTFSPDTIGEEG